MGQNFIAAIGWKLATLLAVVGGGLALGGSFYAGKKVGSSKPPTVIRLPPRMMPMPVIPDPAKALSQEEKIDSSPATDTASQPRPVPVQQRSQATEIPKAEIDKT